MDKMKLLLPTVFLLSCLVVIAAPAQSGKAAGSKPAQDSIGLLMKKVELIPIMINGDKGNRINIVIMNRWTSRDKEPYNSPKMRDEFIRDINESIIAALTPGDPRAQTAFANYREFFNVYGLWYPDTPEWQKGINEETVDAIRDRLFLPWNDEYTGWVTFLVMPNLDQGGGGAARNLEKRVGSAIIAGRGIGKMLHEIAHTCMSIGDEYTAGATGMEAMPTYNVEKEVKAGKIKWRKWIEPGTPLPTPYTAEYRDKVGAFEGAQYHLAGYYRSTAQGCIMGAGVFDNTEKMCPICNQRVAMRVNALVNPISRYSPSASVIRIKGKTRLHFAVNHIRPVPDTQVVRWMLDGKVIASGVDEIDIEVGKSAENEVVCTITDETPFIRPDPPYGQYPVHRVSWKVVGSKTSVDNKTIQAGDIKPELIGEEGIICEAENARIEIPGYEVRTHVYAGHNAFVDFKGKEGSIAWVVNAPEPGIYSVELIYAAISEKGTPMEFSVNGIPADKPVQFIRTLPLYTGWAKTTVTCSLKMGANTITLRSTGNSGVNVDYIRLTPCADMAAMRLFAEGKVKLWFDAADLDGNSAGDDSVPGRFWPVEWKAKATGFPGKIAAKYKPGELNGLGVCGFDNVWVSNLGTDIGSYKTIIMVVKESSMSFPGTCLFRGLNKYIGKSADSGKRLFEPASADLNPKVGKVWLNGTEIDPYKTPASTDFCILTVEFTSEVADKLAGVEGNWEGDIAEVMIIDKTLTDVERKGVELYLRKKWFKL